LDLWVAGSCAVKASSAFRFFESAIAGSKREIRPMSSASVECLAFHVSAQSDLTREVVDVVFTLKSSRPLDFFSSVG
jgi:hypothetical protein